MVYAIDLFIAGENVGEVMNWGATFEEVLGGAGRATFKIYDESLTYEPIEHSDIKAVINRSGHVLFRGKILKPKLELELKDPGRWWTFDCVDYNPEMAARLVGALDGKTWIDDSGFGIFVNIDPNASTLSTDKLTVQNIFEAYFRLADGTAIDTETFVYEYLSNIQPKAEWDYSNVQRVLEELAAMIQSNIQFWIDPDLKFHWVAIPPWQDLGSTGYPLAPGGENSGLPLLFPEGVSSLPLAPHEINDVRASGGAAAKKIVFDIDGSEMPQQVYVKGATGYVFNSPPLPATSETKTVVTEPTPGIDATYKVEIMAPNTKLWHVDNTGYISTSFDLGDPGGPWRVQWVVVPWNAVRNKGGNFWKFIEGPYNGKMVDDHTNGLNGYGEILVTRHSETGGDPEEPKVGVGGSGWTHEVTQDYMKRQAYLEMPLSTTRALRDQFGQQALYRGQYPTIRGSLIDVFGTSTNDALPYYSTDGWRVGQVVKINDARLPSKYNNRYYVIQKVRTSLVRDTDVRKYQIDFGDGPQSRWSAQRRGGDITWPDPANLIVVSAHDLTPGPNSSQTITGQLVNSLGEPWKVAGKVVHWSVEAYNNLGVKINTGTVSPEVSFTDKYGKARTTLTTGAATNIVYFVWAEISVT